MFEVSKRKEPQLGLSHFGGEGGIRTHGTRKGSTVFKTAAFDHSATSPYPKMYRQGGACLLTQAINADKPKGATRMN